MGLNIAKLGSIFDDGFLKTDFLNLTFLIHDEKHTECESSLMLLKTAQLSDFCGEHMDSFMRQVNRRTSHTYLSTVHEMQERTNIRDVNSDKIPAIGELLKRKSIFHIDTFLGVNRKDSLLERLMVSDWEVLGGENIFVKIHECGPLLDVKGVQYGLCFRLSRLDFVENASDKCFGALIRIIPALDSNPIIKSVHFIPLYKRIRVNCRIAVLVIYFHGREFFVQGIGEHSGFRP